MKLNKTERSLVKNKACEIEKKGGGYKHLIMNIKKELGIELEKHQAIYYINQAKELNKEQAIEEEKELLAFLRKKGLNKKQIEELLYHNHINGNKEVKETIGEDGELLLGIVSDTHIGNKLCALDELKEFYEIAKKEGVQAVVHGGDILDGYDVYKGQVFELNKHSVLEQTDEVVKEYPKGVNTYYILGNHDESFLKKVGEDISRIIGMFRDDLKMLGWYNGKIKLNGINIELQHGGGTMSYAVSYKIQKYLETYGPNQQPDIYVLGHYHHSLYMVYRGINAFLPGAFLKENLLARRYKLGNQIGGWIVWIKKKKGKTQIFTKFIGF